MGRTKTAYATHSERLLNALSTFDEVLVVTHDNPDPDAIASGWAICCLVQDRLHKPARLIGGGAIVRAENLHMVELLRPPIELVSGIDASENTAIVLVDCEQATTHHLAARAGIVPMAVIDHHDKLQESQTIPFRDVRRGAAASASIAASYLREQDLEPGPKLATALLYAIHTETRGCQTNYSALDRSILLWLTERAEHELMAEIQSAPLARAYFSDLVLAIQSTYLYGDAALCLLPRARGAEIVGEVADLLIRGRGIRRVLCGAVIANDLLISVRTQNGSDSAVDLLENTLRELGGSGGGHSNRAGGKIAAVAKRGKISDVLRNELLNRWLESCGGEVKRGTPLINRRDIVENL